MKLPFSKKNKDEADLLETTELSDEELAKEYADLIDAIYVQEWTEQTEEQCKAAKAAWDALTDAQKALLPKSAEELLVAAEEAYTKDRTFQCGDAMYKVLPSGNVSYNRPSDTKCTSAVVPNQIKKNGYLYKVVKVSIGAFKNCENLKWVVINKNVGAIGKYAFKNTPSLTKINIKSRILKTGKVVSAFASGGKNNGTKLLVKTPSAYVDSYESLFKGEGLLNAEAKVQAA
ncbi:MAG: leucine-rich repeat protein [Erysipelotrichaceae bacterium]|nr:leucine-rich repeat protein [Erysipelotrichaceae bacterium]